MREADLLEQLARVLRRQRVAVAENDIAGLEAAAGVVPPYWRPLWRHTAKQLAELKRASQSIGCELPEPFLQLAFLSLPVIPSLKLTDQGLVDVNQFKIIDVLRKRGRDRLQKSSVADADHLEVKPIPIGLSQIAYRRPMTERIAIDAVSDQHNQRHGLRLAREQPPGLKRLRQGTETFRHA